MEKTKIVLISSYCDTKEKINVLINTIKTIKSYNLDVMVNSPLPLPSDVINMCDFYVQTKENPLLYWPQKSVMSWVRHTDKNKEIVFKRSVIDYGWAALYQTKKLSEYALTYDYDRYYHIIYDTEIDGTVVSTFLSDKKCNFYPFHEHKVSLHLIALDRENLLKFSNLITFDSYLKFNCIVENWLYDTLIKSDMNYKIELEKIDDLILFHKDENLFNYSDINGLVFFIVKDVVNNDEVCLYFYNNKEKINVLINVDGVETSYDILNKDIINLGFKPYNIKNVLISYDGISSDITEKIKNITHNVIETKIIMNKSKIKLLYLTPHLSTGGMPQFVLKRIQELQKHKDQIEIFLVEYSQFSNTYVVQRDKIIDLLGESHFFSLGDTTDTKRKYELIDIIKNNNIDIVHSEEMLEGFESFNKIPLPLLNQLYSNDRDWKMVETCHNVWFNPQTHKKLNPEAYCFVTPYHLKETFLNETPMKFLSLYPIENKITKILEENEIYGDFNQVPLIEKIKVRNELGLDMFKTHVLNVGLWTSGKNQGEGVEVARELIESNPDIEFHFIGNQAPNFEDYWGPIMNNLPSNVKVWGERNDVEKFMTACDVLMFNSTWECNPLVVRESINYGMKILARDLPQYMGMFDGYITPIKGDVKNISKQLVGLIENKDVYKILPDDTFGEDLLNFYNAVTNINITQNKPLTKDYTFVRHYVNQPYFEVQGTTDNKLNIKYYDDNNNVNYQNELSINSWVKLNKEYFIKWRTTVEENGELIYDETLNLKDKRVFISFGSKSLGDTMAWVPYCEVFRKKHGCKLIVSTFLNSLFKDQYIDIDFVEPGDTVPNIHAQYRLGWHYTSEGVYDKNKHPFDFKKIPLQKTATDILGLDYEEIRPLLNLPNAPKKKKVGIGFHSTAQSKYWNNPDGWQAVVDHLNNLGYECMIYSKEGDGYMNNNYPKGVTIFKGGNLQEVIDDLSSCEFFIGLGSGLSWLAWACKLPVVLISGFSEKWAETTLDTYRVINESVCHGCFNSDRLDAGDWNWCPLHKNTNRMFECTKEISSDMVIKEINKIIKKESNSELVTIILSHANTKEKRKILIEHLKTINTKILLSTNYPIDDEIKVLCDYVIYDEDNPILLKEDFNKYNVSFYFYSIREGVEVRESFDYEHGYAVYKLIQNGLTESKKLGFKYSHIINYDYLINKNTLQDNYKLLENYDSVFYRYKNKSYTQDSYCTGFFTGKIDELIKPFTHYNTKDEYYNYDGYNKILEIITKDAVKKQNLKVKELFYEDLMKTSIVNRVDDNHKNNKEVMEENEFKKISDYYNCDKTSTHTYHNVYSKIFEGIRDEVFSLLEIGIHEGASLNVWRDYLTKANIYGLDINREFSHDRGYIFKGDQNNLCDLEKITSEIKSCKVIIDDASHNPQHQIKTFNYLFENLLEDGGYYIIEDVETSYWDPLSNLYGYEIGYLNVVDYFSKLTHNVNYKYNGFNNTLKIESILFTSNCIVIKKLMK